MAGMAPGSSLRLRGTSIATPLPPQAGSFRSALPVKPCPARRQRLLVVPCAFPTSLTTRHHGATACSAGPRPQQRAREATRVATEGFGRGDWGQVGTQLLFGRCPRNAAELQVLQQTAGADAVLCLQSTEDLEARGVSWAQVCEAAEAAEMLAVQLPMKEFDADAQAASLLDALAFLEFLRGLGHTVHVCCGSGDLVAPLVALGNLTLSHGRSYEEAMSELMKARPSSKPLRIAWDRVVASLTEGSKGRLQELVHQEFRRRLLAREDGSHAQDCQVALEKVAAEEFGRRVIPQRNLAQQISKAIEWEAKRTPVQGSDDLELAAKAANARAASAEAAAQAAQERITFFFRQLSSLKEKEESSRQRAKTLERSTVALEKALVDAGRENERLQRAVRAQEAKAQEALERLRLAVDRAGSGSGGTVLAGVQEMEANLREAEGRLRVSDEKNNFLMRQLTSSREAEQRAKAAARAADTRYTKILQQVEDLARREAAARKAASSAAEKFRAVNAELVDLGCTQEGPAAVQEIRARLHDLGRQVSELKAREEAAEAATAEAMSRLAGVVRRLEKAEEKERELVRSERAATERSAELERRLSLLQQELVEARLAAGSAGQMVSQMSSQVEELRAREAQADEAIRRYEGLRGQVTDMEKRDAAYKGEIAAATERIAALSELISTLSRRETEMCSALEEANEKIEFLSERVGELVQREEVARAASESAEGKVVALSQKLGRLEQTQASAVEEAKSFKARLSISEERERQARQAADQANSRVQELFAKVAEVEAREQMATSAAEQAFQRLEEVTRQMQLQGISREALPSLEAMPSGEASSSSSSPLGAQGLQVQEDAARQGATGSVPWWDAFVFDSNRSGSADLVSSKSGVGAQAPAQQAGGAQARPSQRTLPLAPADSPGEPSAGAGGGPGAGAGAGAGAGPQQQAAAGAVGASEAAELAEKRKVLGATLDECVSLFVSQVAALKEREVASREALSAANKRIEALSGQVSVLAKREEAANALAEEFASQVTELVTRIAELNEELEAAERREAELAEALTACTSSGNGSASGGGTVNGHVTTASKKDAKVLVAELEVARQRADELAAEVEEARKMAEEISENIFGARKRSLQEQQQREELVAEVVALKEAMVLMRERENAITQWKQQLLEQADYLTSLMDEGDVQSSTRSTLQAAVADVQTPI